MFKNTDIVIAGAGPGGCAASLFLAKYKIPHTLIDKAVFPRDKICGDAISGKTVYVLNQLNPEIIPSFSGKQDTMLDSWGVTFVAPNGKGIDIPFTSNRAAQTHAPGFISKRVDFDAELFSML